MRAFFGTVFLTSLLAAVLAAPAVEIEERGLISRAPGDSESDPIPVSLNIETWKDISEQDCYIALCRIGGRRVYKRNEHEGEEDAHYTESGASLTPFNGGGNHGATAIDQTTTGGEDFPFRSLESDSRWTRYVTPTLRDQNNRQGSQIRTGYQRANAGLGKWVKLSFDPPSARGYWCQALHAEPPETDKCDPKKEHKSSLYGHAAILISSYVYHKVKDGNKVKFVNKRDFGTLAPAPVEHSDDAVTFIRDEPRDVVPGTVPGHIVVSRSTNFEETEGDNLALRSTEPEETEGDNL